MGENGGIIPRLRFPEFREAGEWEDMALGAVVKLLSGGTPSMEKSEFWNGSIPWISASSMHETLIKKSDRHISQLAVNNGARVVPAETILILIRGSMLHNRVPIGITTCQVAFNQDVKALLFKIRVSKNFFLYFLISREEQLLRAVSDTGIGAGKLETKGLEVFRVYIPANKDEQQKIADCLSSLDALITAQVDRIDTLKSHKKGLMQQLFPREGENVPRLRFPEFREAGDWVTKQLGELGDVLMCKRIFAEQTNNSQGVPFFKIGTLGGRPDAYISKELFNEYKSKFNYPRKGEVLITCSGTVGKCLPFDGEDAYFQDSNIAWIDNPRSEVSNEFLYLLLSTISWQTLNSTTITRIYGSDLRSLLLTLPTSSEEQQKLIDCLSSLDALIVAQADRLEALRTHKKGLMQQLFPSPEAVSA